MKGKLHFGKSLINDLHESSTTCEAQVFLYFTAIFCCVKIMVRGRFCPLPLSFLFLHLKNKKGGREDKKRGSLVTHIMKVILKDSQRT